MHIQHIFTASPTELATGKAFEILPEEWHEPIVTAVEFRHRHRNSVDLDLSLESATLLDKLLRAALRANPKRVSRLVRSIGCYASALLIQHCDAEFAQLSGAPIFLRYSNPDGGDSYTSGIRLAIDGWESGKPRFADALAALRAHIFDGAERPSYVPVYNVSDPADKLRDVRLYGHSLQAILGRFEQESWNLLFSPQTLRRVDEILDGDVDGQLAIRLGTVSTTNEGISQWQAHATAAFFGELVREQLGGRWIQPRRGPLEMDLGLDDTLFSPLELCTRAVARQSGDYPLLRAYQSLMDYLEAPHGPFPLEDLQMPRQVPEDDGETEATAAWDVSMLAAGAAAESENTLTASPSPAAGDAYMDELETREAVSPSSHSNLAVHEELMEVTKTSDVAALRAGTDGSRAPLAPPEPGGSTRKYNINELQRALVQPQAEQAEPATAQYDGAALAAAFSAKQAAAPPEHESTRQYTTDELMRGLGGGSFKTAEQPSPDGDDDEAGMSTREYNASELAEGISGLKTGNQPGIAAPPDPFATAESSYPDPFADLMDESEDGVEIDIDASFDADELYDQMLDNPEFASQDTASRLKQLSDPTPISAQIQTLAEWTEQHDGSQDGVKSSPVTIPVQAVRVESDEHEDATRNVGLFLPELARLNVDSPNDELTAIRSQLMPVLVSHDWERKGQVAFEPLLKGIKNSPLVTLALDYPEKLVYVNSSDIKEWRSSFAILKTMALDNLARSSSELDQCLGEVELSGEPIYQLSTGDYFEASRVLLGKLGEVAGGLLSTDKMWVSVPNRNILLVTAATSQRQLESFAEITDFCFTDKQFPLTPDVFFFGLPGPAIQRVVKV